MSLTPERIHVARSGYVKNPLDRTVRTPTGCLEWTGKRHKGYGVTTFGRNSTVFTHRKVWMLTFGAIPAGLCVLHRCDNPPCCNPDHLFLGTALDNARDRTAKGRGGGEKFRALTTHCKHGHEYTPENTYVGYNCGGRTRTKWCRTCRRESHKRYLERNLTSRRARATGVA